MPLSKFVKVGNISNLSDARFCAGMGVDMLGFRVVEGQEHYIAPQAFQEIRGWISGPGIVAEIYGLRDAAALDAILENYRPDYLELGWHELPYAAHTSLPLILSVQADEAGQIAGHALHTRIAHVVVRDFSGQGAVDTTLPVLAEITSTDVRTVLEAFPSYGIALNGSPEIRPGLKSFDHLAEVLELLDE